MLSNLPTTVPEYGTSSNTGVSKGLLPLYHRSISWPLAATWYVLRFNQSALFSQLWRASSHTILTDVQVMAPAIMGNVILWKPSDTAILGSYRMYMFFFIVYFAVSLVAFFYVFLFHIF